MTRARSDELTEIQCGVRIQRTREPVLYALVQAVPPGSLSQHMRAALEGYLLARAGAAQPRVAISPATDRESSHTGVTQETSASSNADPAQPNTATYPDTAVACSAVATPPLPAPAARPPGSVDAYAADITLRSLEVFANGE